MTAQEQRPVTARVCSHCAAVLPAGAHPSRTTCGPECKSAIYRAAKRERRRAEAHVPPNWPLDCDGIAAALAARERAIITTWRDRS